MSILADLKMYARFAWGLRGFLHHTISLAYDWDWKAIKAGGEIFGFR